MVISCSPQCAILTCSPCQELQLLQDEVDAAQETLNAAEVALRDAKRRRAAHVEGINMRKAAVTKLPPEIMRTIIDIYMESPEHDIDPTAYSTYPLYKIPRWFRAVHRGAPLFFGTISQQWRAVAWSYAGLWETIVIPLACPGHDHGPQMVSEWLQRSCDRPLSIQMNDPKDTEDDNFHRGRVEKARIQENARAVIRVLNQHATRWHTLDFSETAIDILENLDDGRCADVSRLHHLCLGGHWNHRAVDNVRPLLRMSKRVHRPTHLNILSFMTPQSINIDWTHLTHLFAAAISCHQLLELLNPAAAQLTHLSVRAMNAYESDYDPSEDATLDTPLQLPALVSLSIYACDTQYADLQLLLRSIIAPALRAFSYNGDDSDMVFPGGDILRFMVRSNCLIADLELLGHELGNDELEFFLRSIPTVEHLKIRLDHTTDSQYFLRCMSAARLKVESQPFLPALRRLDIKAYWPRPSWAPFIAMYSSTRPGEVPARAAMKVKYTMSYMPKLRYGGNEYTVCSSFMDRSSLTSLVRLWKSFGIACAFYLKSVESFKPESELGFLLRSFHANASQNLDSVDPPTNDLEYGAMYEDVVALSKVHL